MTCYEDRDRETASYMCRQGSRSLATKTETERQLVTFASKAHGDLLQRHRQRDS